MATPTRSFTLPSVACGAILLFGGCLTEERRKRGTSTMAIDSAAAVVIADSVLNFPPGPRRGEGRIPHTVLEFRTVECGYLVYLSPAPPAGEFVTGGGGAVLIPTRGGPCAIYRNR